MNGENDESDGFKERYAEFLEHFDLTPNSLAAAVGDGAKVKYFNYLKGPAKPNSETLALIAKKFPVSLDWLVFGEGDMIRHMQGSFPMTTNTPPLPSKVDLDLAIRYKDLEQRFNDLTKRHTKLVDAVLKEKMGVELDFLKASGQTTVYYEERNLIGYGNRGKVYLSRGPIPTHHLTPGWPHSAIR